MRNGTHVVVTTNKDRRGVFGGKLVKYDPDKQTCTIKESRMAVYWSADVRGVVGLASSGPTASCRITPAAPQAELNGVTAVIEMSAAARKAWEKEPWN